jgi:hypothetical protein
MDLLSLNLDNYARWLFDLSERMEKHQRLTGRSVRLSYILYRLTTHSIRTGHNKPDRRFEAIQTEQQRVLNAIREMEQAPDLNLNEVYNLFKRDKPTPENVAFFPDEEERLEIEQRRDEYFQTDLDQLNRDLCFPVRPIVEILKEKLAGLTYRYPHFYADPQPLHDLTERKTPRVAFAFYFAIDWATYRLSQHIKARIQKIETGQSADTSPDPPNRFHWKASVPDTVGLIKALIGTGTIPTDERGKTAPTQKEVFTRFSRFLGVNLNQPDRDFDKLRNRNGKQKKPAELFDQLLQFLQDNRAELESQLDSKNL